MANIGPISGSKVLSGTQKPDLRQLVRKLKKKIDGFNELIPSEEDKLPEFADATVSLDDSSREALELTKKPVNRLMEDAQDSAETVQAIITQPLNIEGASENVSLISAAVSFDKENQKDSDLYKISQSFLKYPDQTASLKMELTLSSQDLAAY